MCSAQGHMTGAWVFPNPHPDLHALHPFFCVCVGLVCHSYITAGCSGWKVGGKGLQGTGGAGGAGGQGSTRNSGMYQKRACLCNHHNLGFWSRIGFALPHSAAPYITSVVCCKKRALMAHKSLSVCLMGLTPLCSTLSHHCATATVRALEEARSILRKR